ncbi:MAG: HPr kinase/phosphatase C-terminal domain-containing protein [Roseivivax sp.]|nr:HPr kinase/phosphatase C-terminal domain-containing protein [Roseivivax sp.]
MGGSAGDVWHASSVAVSGRGLLILGASGSGKSSLALQMMALGALLVADDRTVLTLRDGAVWLSSPPTIRGRIEARGIGILNAQSAPDTVLHAVIDLGQVENNRLPPERSITLLGCSFPLLHGSASPNFPAGVMQFLRAGRAEGP